MEEERIWILLSRKLTNEAIPAELAELDMLLGKHPELIPIVKEISDAWQQTPLSDPEFMEATYFVHLQRMKERGIVFYSEETENHSAIDSNTITSTKKRTHTLLFALCSLATIAFIVSMCIYFYTKANHSSKEYSNALAKGEKEIVTENGTRTKTILPDGTVVWLNAGSKVTYEGDFLGPIREVKLTGEAYFDVAKNPQRPFIVRTGDINVKALGTAFSIRSYPSDKLVEATLFRGLVEISRENDDKAKPIYLHPDQKLTLVKNAISVNPITALEPGGSYTISKIEKQDEKELPETSWMFNRLSFKEDDFETLARKLERWYNISIIFEDEAVKKIRFNGSLENETVEQALAALQMAGLFSYTIQGNEIHISSLK